MWVESVIEIEPMNEGFAVLQDIFDTFASIISELS
jgi:hypothetical protein